MGALGSLIGPAISLFGLATSGSGSTSGISPQQAALAEYMQGQNILKNNAAFASQGTGMSTMSSLADAGAAFGATSSAAGTADANAAAQQQASQSSLQSLASSFGTTQGNFGNTGGNLNTSSSNTPAS